MGSEIMGEGGGAMRKLFALALLALVGAAAIAAPAVACPADVGNDHSS
jgi:hypothetical protein